MSLLGRTYVASNAIQTIDNERLWLIIYCLNCILTRRKLNIRATYKPRHITLLPSHYYQVGLPYIP